MMPTDFALQTRPVLMRAPDELGIRSDGTGLFRLALVESACDFTLESAGFFGCGIVSCRGGAVGGAPDNPAMAASANSTHVANRSSGFLLIALANACAVATGTAFRTSLIRGSTRRV